MSLRERIRNRAIRRRLSSPERAASLIKRGMTVAVGGYTQAGYPKVVPMALARHAREEPGLNLTLISGASVGPEIDSALAQAGVISRRLPLQADPVVRRQANEGSLRYIDLRLGRFPTMVRAGWLGQVDVAIVEALAVTAQGFLVPTTSVGATPALLSKAQAIIVEINLAQPLALEGLHDVYLEAYPPDGSPVPARGVLDRLGKPWIEVDPERILAVVESQVPDPDPAFPEPGEDPRAMAAAFGAFLREEAARGRLPDPLPPLQPGLGTLANGLMAGLSESLPGPLSLFSGVLQEGGARLLVSGKAREASTGALLVSPATLRGLLECPRCRQSLIIRSSDVSNNPEVIRRLGILATNTAIEVDIYGHVNVSHILGTQVVSGIGGGAEFAREGLVSAFFLRSSSQKGQVSGVVPMASHVDHTEHDVDVIVTEQGLADLRGLDPRERAAAIIENCAHPGFRPGLLEYLEEAGREGGHEPHLLDRALSWHARLKDTGSMKT
jgi:succinyl-CoA:acetate CoA-transferase